MPNTATPATANNAAGSNLLDSRTLIASLLGTQCPACRRDKKRSQTFCFSCYKKLPKGQQFALYKRVDQGYAEAVDAACKTLGVTFHAPGGGS